MHRLPPGIRREFRSYLAGAGLDGPALVERDVAEAMTAPYRWLARRIGPDGLTLTAAGWLPPAVVHEAMTELGWARALDRQSQPRGPDPARAPAA